MSKRSVFCLSSSRGRSDRIVHELKEAEFSSTDISVVLLDHGTTSPKQSKSEVSDTARTAAAQPAGEIRGVLGWLAGVRSLTIRGGSRLIVAGPVASALSCATSGGIAGGLVDFGVPQVEAALYEDKIKDGCMLIAVHAENPEKSEEARDLFTGNEAENICTLIEVSTPKVSCRGAGDGPRT